MTKDQRVFDAQRKIFAGKFRRYHGESWVKRVLDVKTNLLNIRDFVYVVLGMFESMVLLIREKPDVILLKGGFVGMPVGLAAALLRIPYITHDSDALPGLANRVVARWARWHATGMPASFYTYKQGTVKYVGVLVGDAYTFVTDELRHDYRRQLNIPFDATVLMVTGGSNGSQKLNQAMAKHIVSIKAKHPRLYVLHQTGIGNEGVYADIYPNGVDWIVVQDLFKQMYRYSGAADVVVTRAGANTLAEFGVQGKACVVVPNPLLTGGHQLINAAELEKHQAVVVIKEAELGDRLEPVLTELLEDEKLRHAYGKKLRGLSKVDAAEKLAKLLYDTVEHRKPTDYEAA